MEVYKDISNTQKSTILKLLIDNFSKTKIEEGKLLTGTVTKTTEKHVYLLIDGMKSEAMIDLNEIKTVFSNKQFKEGEKLEVYLEKLKIKNGEVIVSVSKAQKNKRLVCLQKAYEENQMLKVKLFQKLKVVL